MRNRYKRDLNRLITHPRSRTGSKSLRSPGALSGVYSSASGLPREPAFQDLPLYVLGRGAGIYKLQPDILGASEFIGGDSTTLGFAYTDGRLAYMNSSGVGGSRRTKVFFDNGVSIQPTVNYEVRITGGANSTNFIVRYADTYVAQAEYLEVYDLDGALISRHEVSGNDLDWMTFSGGDSVPTNGEFAYYLANDTQTTLDLKLAKIRLSDGARVALYDRGGTYQHGYFAETNRLYMCNAPNAYTITILDEAEVSVGSWSLQRAAGRYEAIAATPTKGYAFWNSTSENTSFCEIYNRSGDTFTFSSEVDMVAEHGLTRVLACMPDMKDLLATTP